MLSILVNALPHNWQIHIDKWLPAIAGMVIWAVKPQTGSIPYFAPWTGFAVLCGWAAVFIGAGMYLFRKRNA